MVNQKLIAEAIKFLNEKLTEEGYFLIIPTSNEHGTLYAMYNHNIKQDPRLEAIATLIKRAANFQAGGLN